MNRSKRSSALLPFVLAALPALLLGSSAWAAADDCAPPKSLVNPVYDSAGRLMMTDDANGGRLSYVYDAASRLTQCIDAKGFVTHIQYDGNGNRITVPDRSASAPAKQ